MRAFPAALAAIVAFTFVGVSLWQGWSGWWTSWAVVLATCSTMKTTTS